MGFARKKQEAPRISADRLASVAGGAYEIEEDVEAAAPRTHVSLEPDLSRIRPRCVDETPEAHKKRLAAKTINFTTTILARLAIMGALGNFLWETYQLTGNFHRGAVIGVFVLLVDLGRVIMKAMEPGTK
ncbi:MAG: hypothetical protein AAFW68_08780 [Pseudomonadota bacterium]